ncbi:MAG TPA: YciI family protein [Gemmatimonadales bacterium]
MRYLCLIYEDEKAWESLPPAEAEAIMGEYFAFTEDIRKNGKYIAGEALHPTATASTVRVRNGKVSTTDGPFAETKEQLGGFYLIEATDLNDAIQVASRIPSARHGSVEVRPVVDFSKEMGKCEEAEATAKA